MPARNPIERESRLIEQAGLASLALLAAPGDASLAVSLLPRLRLPGAGRHRAGPEAFQMVLEMEAPEGYAAWPGRGCLRLRPGGSRRGAAVGRGLLSAGCHAAVPREFARGGPGRSPSRSGCWGGTGWTLTIPSRTTSCGRCRGGHSRRCSSSASCMRGARGSSRGWI